MPRFKHVSGLGNVQLTPEEEAERDSEEAKWEKEQQEYLKVKYKDDRRPIYPEIGDQLDDLFKQGVFSEEMAQKIKEVKNAFPKPKNE